jgi:hypothetical protein
MSPTTRHVKQHAKARQRRRRTAQERLAHDCRQAQDAAKVTLAMIASAREGRTVQIEPLTA